MSALCQKRTLFTSSVRLESCDYTAEFIEFLKGLEKEGPNTELLIVGDTFGFWELTLVQGVEKLDYIITAHQAIFDQLRATGARIKITMMVGNHDYDLACNADFASRLQIYNIHLDKSLLLIRPVGDKKIWIEHGQHRIDRCMASSPIFAARLWDWHSAC